jgi:hypothetical protein
MRRQRVDIVASRSGWKSRPDADTNSFSARFIDAPTLTAHLSAYVVISNISKHFSAGDGFGGNFDRARQLRQAMEILNNLAQGL